MKWRESVSRIWFSVIPWTVGCQVPQSMEFSRQEYWSGLLFPSPGDVPDSRTEPMLLRCKQILYHLSHQGRPFHLLTIDEMCLTVNSVEKKKKEPEKPVMICSPNSSVYRWEKSQRGRVTGRNTQELEIQLGLTSQPSASSPMIPPPLHYCLCKREGKCTHRILGICKCACLPI